MNTWQPTSPGQWTRTLSFPLTTRLHVPGEDGRLWDASVPVGTTWTPAMARANFLIVEEAGRFTLLAPYEDRPAFFGWTLGRAAKQLNVTWSVRLATALPGREQAPPPGWSEQSHSTRDAAVDTYRTWMQRAFPQPPRFRPPWVERIPGCVLLQLWAGTGEIDHTLDDLVGLMAAMHAAGVPRDTLVYFWGWFASFDRKYPEFWPAPEVGGEAAFTRVIEAAIRYGYRLLPHTNHHGFCEDSPGFAEFAADQTTDANGKKLGWREKGEPAIEYMRPNSARWRAHNIGKLKRFI